MPDRECLAPAELARELGIGERQARAWINSGGIYSFRIGRRILVPRAALRRLLEAGGTPVTEPGQERAGIDALGSSSRPE